MRSAIVGCGNISRFHIHAINTSPLAYLAAVCDSNEQLAADKARELGVKSYSDLDEMLNNEDLDVLHVLVPPQLHREVAVKALSKGIHVLVEKPMAISVKDADAMIAAAEENNVKLGVNHNMLFEPTYIKARDLVNSYEFGELLHADAFMAFDVRRTLGGNSLDSVWQSKIKGHFLQDLLPHPASVVVDLLRGYNKAHVVYRKNDQDRLQDEVRLMIEGNTATATIALSLSTHPDVFTLNLYGTKMILKVDFANMSVVKQKTYKVPKKLMRGVDSMSQSVQIMGNTIGTILGLVLKRISEAGGMAGQIHAFYESLDKDWPLPVSGADAKAVVELSDKIWK